MAFLLRCRWLEVLAVAERILRFVREQPLGTAGFVIVLVMASAAFFADYLAPYDPLALSLEAMLLPPSTEHFFGTDALGRVSSRACCTAHGQP